MLRPAAGIHSWCDDIANHIFLDSCVVRMPGMIAVFPGNGHAVRPGAVNLVVRDDAIVGADARYAARFGTHADVVVESDRCGLFLSFVSDGGKGIITCIPCVLFEMITRCDPLTT